MRVLSKILIVTWVGFGASMVFANEEEIAKEACLEVMNKLSGDMQENGISLCKYNVRAPIYWQCISKRLDDGQSFEFSASRCEKLDPQPSYG